MYKLKIKVTKEILKKSILCGINGIHKYSENCAIALACKEIFPNCHVGQTLMYINNIPIDLPTEARDFIRKFDILNKEESRAKRLELPELEFEVELSNTIIEHININEAKEAIKNSTTLELIES